MKINVSSGGRLTLTCHFCEKMFKHPLAIYPEALNTDMVQTVVSAHSQGQGFGLGIPEAIHFPRCDREWLSGNYAIETFAGEGEARHTFVLNVGADTWQGYDNDRSG